MSKEKELKEENKQEPEKKVTPAPKPLVHVGEFIDSITPMYNLNTIQQAGFRASMAHDQYKEALDDFVPYLDKYLGK